MEWGMSEKPSRPGLSQSSASHQNVNALPALRFTPPNHGNNTHTSTHHQSLFPLNSPHSDVPAPQLPSWARAQQAASQKSHKTSLPVFPKSPIKQLLQHPDVNQEDEPPSRSARPPSVASQNSQFRVLLKSSPLKPSHYQKMDDDLRPPPLLYTQAPPLRQSRKRPEPGAMGVRNMMSAALTGGPVDTPDTITRDTASSNDGGGTGASTSSTEHINKRGRPKGWKPGMSYAAIRGNTPSKPYVPKPKSTSSAVPGRMARRGRKPGSGIGGTSLVEIMRKQYSRAKPDFTPFYCEWVDEVTGQRCPAELQNWETLKRHVFMLHTIDIDSTDPDSNPSPSPSFSSEEEDDDEKKGKESSQICRWGSCAKLDPPRIFPNEDSLDEHLLDHLRSVAWHLGDGHRNRSVVSIVTKTDNITTLPTTDPDAPEAAAKPKIKPELAYLFNEDGEQVTPSIKDQVLETEKARQERRRRLRLLMDMRDENAPDEDEFLKQTLGEGEERGGSGS